MVYLGSTEVNHYDEALCMQDKNYLSASLAGGNATNLEA